MNLDSWHTCESRCRRDTCDFHSYHAGWSNGIQADSGLKDCSVCSDMRSMMSLLGLVEILCRIYSLYLLSPSFMQGCHGTLHKS